MKSKSLLHLCAASLLLAPALRAQDDGPPKNRTRDTELGQISVIDKLLAIEASLSGKLKRSTEDQWAKDYETLYQQFERNGQLAAIPGGGEKEITNALVLGIKASDAVVALKARDVEGLNQSAEQIEQLALKLGASKKELGMAETVKRYANSGRWLDSFMALGFLQRNVLSYLRENPDKKPQAVLIIVGGWLQGGRCVTHVVDENYTADVSNILREPRLVALIKENMDALPPAYLSDPLVTKIDGLLPEIKKRVNVGLHDPVKPEDVKWLNETFNSLVLEIAPVGAAGAKPDVKAPAGSTPKPAPGAKPSADAKPAASDAKTPAIASTTGALPPIAEPPAGEAKPPVAVPAAAPAATPAAKPWWKIF
jgi:hypothetical protein